MPAADQILDRLVRAFGVGTEQDIARKLMQFLVEHEEAAHINLQLVRQLTEGGESGGLDREILRTLQFLAGDGIGLLETKFEIFDEQDNPHNIDNLVVRDAINLQLNPLTGERDPQVEKKIFMYFSPSPQPFDLNRELRG